MYSVPVCGSFSFATLLVEYDCFAVFFNITPIVCGIVLVHHFRILFWKSNLLVKRVSLRCYKCGRYVSHGHARRNSLLITHSFVGNVFWMLFSHVSKVARQLFQVSFFTLRCNFSLKYCFCCRSAFKFV